MLLLALACKEHEDDLLFDQNNQLRPEWQRFYFDLPDGDDPVLRLSFTYRDSVVPGSDTKQDSFWVSVRNLSSGTLTAFDLGVELFADINHSGGSAVFRRTLELDSLAPDAAFPADGTLQLLFHRLSSPMDRLSLAREYWQFSLPLANIDGNYAGEVRLYKRGDTEARLFSRVTGTIATDMAVALTFTDAPEVTGATDTTILNGITGRRGSLGDFFAVLNTNPSTSVTVRGTGFPGTLSSGGMRFSLLLSTALGSDGIDSLAFILTKN